MAKITYSEYLEMARNPEVDDDVLLSYSIIQSGVGGFDYSIKADPKKVELTAEDIEFESAMKIGNGLARFRRQAQFRRKKFLGSKKPILVSEGDSWLQFPFLIREIVDQLSDEYLIWSVGAAGDTAENIIYGRTEYMQALYSQKDDVQGFLFSAAGNDIIGEDPITQRAVLFDLVKDFNGDIHDIEGHIDLELLEEKMDFLREAYTEVIDEIRSEEKFKKLPIFIHGYDYVFPYPWKDDPRHPQHAKKNEWLGKPLDAHGIQDKEQRRNIIKYMIDELYSMFSELAGDPEITGVYLVDCRNAMPDVSDWIDEIHGTSDGFKKIADRFRPIIADAIKRV